MLVSLYHYMRHFNQNVRDKSFCQFIRMHNQFDLPPDHQSDHNRVEYWKAHVAGWLERPRIVPVSYEQLHDRYESTVVDIGQRFNLEPLPSIREVHVSPNRMWSLAIRVARKMGIQAKTSVILPHKGTTGAWRDHFSKQDLEFFYRCAGRLPQELGYR
jgi:hypothetical protein